MNDSLVVHPLMSPRYYGFYLSGLEEQYGSARLSTKSFPKMIDPKSGMAAILPGGRKIYIAANDHAWVDAEFVNWADVVAQVNVDPMSTYPANVLPIGPGFGTPWNSTRALVVFVLRSGLMTRPERAPAMLRDYLHAQSERAPLGQYVPGVSSSNEIYFIANYWQNADAANLRRLRFVQAAASNSHASFSGGFWSNALLPEEYRPFQLTNRVDHRDYLRRIKRSAVVFNTPAVHDCLGWKLGEYLALGKAIISTPLGRVMPGDFISGEQIHIVTDDSEAAFGDAVELLLSDRPYREHLERSARRYWEEYLTPVRVVQRIAAASASS